jgi:hypothetical protein
MAEETKRYSVRRPLYILCFFMFCLIDQRTKTCSGLDGLSETFRDAMGLVMAVVIMSHYKIEEFRKRKFLYLLWCIVGAAAGIGALIWGIGRKPFLNDWIMIIADIFVWGFILIHTVIDVVVEKKYAQLNRKTAILWIAMMVYMIISRSTYIWPLCYLIMFGCFYLTDFTEDEKTDLIHGSLEGIILAFIVFQAYCCVFRPYDMLRYVGIHNNPNLNALFYLYVLAASLIKSAYAAKEHKPLVLRLFYHAVSGASIVYLFMTVGRIGWIAAVILCVMYIVWVNKGRLQKKVIRNGLAILASVLIMFPICFSATRYLPPLFHHPVWFWGEWSEDKVHSWDPWNSDKYTDIDELMDTAAGRIVDSVKNLLEHSPLLLKVEAAEDSGQKTAVLEVWQGYDSILVRKTIYTYYFKHLNLLGHPYEEQGFQLTASYWIGHAHNIYLQYGTDFGIPVMIIFMILIVIGIAKGFKNMNTDGIPDGMAAQFFVIIPAVFGLFEYSWGVASLSITMLFLAWRAVIAAKK